MPEAEESWAVANSVVVEEFRQKEHSRWGFGGNELVKNSTSVIKVCQLRFDRNACQ